MKSRTIVLLATLSLAAASHGEIAISNRPPMRKAPTNEELIKQLRQSEQEMAKAAASRPASTTVDPRADKPAPDLFSSSEILCYNGAFTLVPKRAVLQFPKNLSDRLTAQHGAKVQNWSEFYAANRNWITTVEVTKQQAAGGQGLPEETTTHINKCGKLVVATFQGHPISVHPVPVPVVPGEPAADGAAPAAPAAPAPAVAPTNATKP